MWTLASNHSTQTIGWYAFPRYNKQVLKKLLPLLFVFVASAVGWQVHSITNPPQVYSQGASCSIIGNNTARPFGEGGEPGEASFFLASLSGSQNVQPIIDAINGNPNTTIIIRLGAATTDPGPKDPLEYAGFINQIAAAVNGRNFVAMVSHNEANCAEYQPLADEIAYATAVTGAVTASNVTLIAGQVDHYCENNDNQGGTAQGYLEGLAGVPGVEGVSLPFYTINNFTTGRAATDHFNKYSAMTNGLPIYVTESGPLHTNSMAEFTIGVDLVLKENGNITAFLLFNAFGLNPQFGYTKPFWNPACREAFRTKCTDPAEVLRICGEDVFNNSYYLYNIEGLDPSKSAPQDRAIGIFNDLVNQGYEASCTTPSFTIAGKRSDEWQRYIELVKQGSVPSVVFDVESTLTYDAAGSQVPLWRDFPSINNGVKSSIEDYFGHRAPKTDNPQTTAIDSGVVYSRLDLEGQCNYQIKMLESIDVLCNQLKEPEACALYQPIDGSAYTTQTLLPAIKGLGMTCKELTRDPDKLPADQKTIYTSLGNVPLFLEKAYRLAFLVVSAELKEDTRPEGFFNFFTSINPGKDPFKQEVRVIAFKIPDVGTNKKRDEGYYDDPLQITRDSLQTEKQIATRIEQQEEDKVEFRNKPPGAVKINCVDPICGDPLTKALVDIINRTEGGSINNSCKISPEDVEAEASGQIKDSGTLEPVAGATPLTPTASPPASAPTNAADPSLALTFKENYNIIKNLITNPPEQKENPQKATFNFLSILEPAVENEGTTSEVSAYLIYPVGYDLKDIEDTIAASIFTPEALARIKENEIKDYFQLSGIQVDFAADSQSYSYVDLENCPTDPLTGLPLASCTKKVTVSLEDDGNDRTPRILGARLGYFMRAAEQTLFKFNSDFWNFVDSCQTTENFLLGKCGGRNPEGALAGTEVNVDFSNSEERCRPLESGPCSVDNLKGSFGGDLRKATVASIICNRETRGRPEALNTSCLTGETADYSVGLFQINALAHCRGTPPPFSSWSLDPPACVVGNQNALNTCVNEWLTVEGNVKMMVTLSSVDGVPGENWVPWRTTVCKAEVDAVLKQ